MLGTWSLHVTQPYTALCLRKHTVLNKRTEKETFFLWKCIFNGNLKLMKFWKSKGTLLFKKSVRLSYFLNHMVYIYIVFTSRYTKFGKYFW